MIGSAKNSNALIVNEFINEDSELRYNAIAIRSEGYPEELGKNLFLNWTDNRNIANLCCSASEIRYLGSNPKETEFYLNNKFTLKCNRSLKALKRQDLMITSKLFNFIYVRSNSIWYIMDKRGNLKNLEEALKKEGIVK